jgi:hypothetical protein
VSVAKVERQMLRFHKMQRVRDEIQQCDVRRARNVSQFCTCKQSSKGEVCAAARTHAIKLDFGLDFDPPFLSREMEVGRQHVTPRVFFSQISLKDPSIKTDE